MSRLLYALFAGLCLCYTTTYAQTLPPLNEVPDAVAAFSFDRLHASHPDPVVRVRRSSDGAEQDFGLLGEAFDRSAFDAFVGSDTAFATILYDQSGMVNNGAQLLASRQPLVVDGPGTNPVLSLNRTHGIGIPGAYDHINGANELTIFVAARWDGALSGNAIHLLTAGRYVPAGWSTPLSIFLHYVNGAPSAQVRLADDTRVELGSVDFGRKNVFEIHELVFDKDDRISLYNSGRLVAERAVGGLSLLTTPPWGDGVFLGANGSYNRGLTGQIAPPLVFGRALTESERALVRQDMAASYGIALPDNTPPSGDEFTIAFFPDTQQYAAGTNGVNSQMIQNAVDWLRAHKSAWNVQLVMHPGDIVDEADNPGEWIAADGWYDSLDLETIPYALAVGNHDYQGSLTNRNSENFNVSFPTTRFTTAPWWTGGGFFESGKSDNMYFFRSMGGTQYLILTLEFQPRADVVEWANEVLAAHPDRQVIILTHDFMDERARFDATTYPIADATSSQELYDTFISRHENIFLVLNGHHARGAARRYDEATDAHYLYFDPMLLDWGTQALIRLLVVSPSKGTIRTMTYSPDQDLYRSDFRNLFTLDVGAQQPPDGNTPPSISPISNQSIAEDTSSDPLSFSVGDLETPPDQLLVSAVSDNQTILPNGNLLLSGSGADRTITVSPAPDQNGGPVNVTVTVNDGHLSAQSSFSVTVTSVDDPPSFVSAPVTTAVTGRSYTYSIDVYDPDTGDQATIVAEVLPAWLVLSESPTPVLSGIPQAADVGPHQVRLRATDNAGQQATQEFVIEVATLGMEGFALLAEKKIVLDKHLDSVGDLHSNGDLEIKEGLPSILTGNVTAVGEVKVDKKNTIVGSSQSGDRSDIHDDASVTVGWSEEQDVARVELPVIEPFTEGSADVEVSDGEVVNLAPGEYDEVKVGKDAVLHLSPGHYRVRRIEIGERSTLAADVDGGRVTVGTTDKFTFKKFSVAAVTPPEKALDLVFQSIGDSDIKLDDGSHFRGTIVAPFAKLVAESGATIEGRIAAEEIQIREETRFGSAGGEGMQVSGTAAAVRAKFLQSSTPPADPAEFSLASNFPNPFQSWTTISFQLPDITHARLTVFDLLGRTVKVLVDGDLQAGRHEVKFLNRGLPAGVYVYRLTGGGRVATGKMTILR